MCQSESTKNVITIGYFGVVGQCCIQLHCGIVLGIRRTEQYICNSELSRNLWRQRGQMVRALDLQFGGPEFKSRPER